VSELDREASYLYCRTEKRRGCARDSEVYNSNNSIILIRVCLTEILAVCVLKPRGVGGAYEHVSGACCFYLHGGSAWCVLWSVYIGMLIVS
jgi:hypothetical protein